MDANTLRVLSLDGGGVRGYFSAIFLQNFVKLWGIPGTDLWKYFDVICGSSIGGIQALGYAYGLGPDDIVPVFTDKAPMIFTNRGVTDALSCNASTPANRPGLITKINDILSNDYFYQSVQVLSNGTKCETNNYGSVYLKTVLTETLGQQTTLQDLKTNVLITAYDRTNKKPVLFSNYNHPAFIGQNFLAADVGMTTSAAPVLYLPPYFINGVEYIDGGTFQNNPSNVGLTLAKMIKPTANRFCVLSVGTGRGELAFDELSPPLGAEDLPFSRVIGELTELLGVSMDGCSETVARALELEANYSPFSNLFYYRFNALIDSTKTDLDDASQSSLEYLQSLSQSTFEKDQNKINIFLGHLTA